MSYFSEQYNKLRYPLAIDGNAGFRNAQIGGTYAIGSHFTVSDDPALVVMPTGTGKTAVLMVTPFLRRSVRVLVITPSKLVRNQVAEDFAALAVLKRMGVLPKDTPGPSVFELRNRIHNVDAWESMKDYDVVVATPNGISPEYEGVPKPPEDHFDLLLIDEAHHSPARTWKIILDCFPKAEKILFTATPYRQDSREIKGKLIYSYPIRAAFEDKIFGKVRFYPIEPKKGESNDVAIAKATEETFKRDRAAGLRHCVMVRTSQIKRADELVKIYAENTSLRLQSVTSQHSYSHLKKTIKGLKDGGLDGVICVDMMSEGFDFPWLKIAAVHAPHKSLGVTLQFIGRFARTNATDIGEAKFLAVTQEIKSEVQVLYDDNAVWQDIIIDLQHGRLEEEQETREAIESFKEPIVADFDTDDLSLYSLWPYSHVKIYRVDRDMVDIGTKLKLPRPFEVIFQRVSEELSTAVIIANEQQEPRWTELPVFNRSEFDLFVVHYDVKEKLLFINASRKSESLYEEIANQYTFGAHKILPLYIINRVLHGIDKPEFFNVGMKNRIAHDHAESYRIITGPRAALAVNKSDGRLYHRGHIFGKGMVKGDGVTIGYSSASKVWSNQNLQIPQLTAWCQELARRFAIEGPLPSHEGLDHLSVGEQLKAIPEGIIVAQWPPIMFNHHVNLDYTDLKGQKHSFPISGVELSLDRANTDDRQISFVVVSEKLEYGVRFRLDGKQFFEPVDAAAPMPSVVRKGEHHPLLVFLNNNPVEFLCADYSLIRGSEHVRYSKTDFQPLDDAALQVIDWDKHNVDITKEFAKAGVKAAAKRTVHAFLRSFLDRNDQEVVIYDHRVGEAADFITFSREGDKVVITLYHCKGSGGAKPGDRVDDLYEVCGQGIKCLIWIESEPDLLAHIRKRTAAESEFVRGNFKAVKACIDHGLKHGFVYQVYLVQPGITKAGLTQKLGEVLAATRDYLLHSGVRDFFVMASK